MSVTWFCVFIDESFFDTNARSQVGILISCFIILLFTALKRNIKSFSDIIVKFWKWVIPSANKSSNNNVLFRVLWLFLKAVGMTIVELVNKLCKIIPKRSTRYIQAVHFQIEQPRPTRTVQQLRDYEHERCRMCLLLLFVLPRLAHSGRIL